MQWFIAAHTFPNKLLLSTLLDFARWCCHVNVSLILSPLILSPKKSLIVCKVAYNLCLLPKVLTLVGMRCCLSVVTPFLVAAELQAKPQGRIPQDMLLIIACGPGSWLIILLPACDSCQSPDVTSTSPSACHFLLSFSPTHLPTLRLSVCFCKLTAWVGWSCLWMSAHPWKCQDVAQLLQAARTPAWMLVSKVVSECMHEKHFCLAAAAFSKHRQQSHLHSFTICQV